MKKLVVAVGFLVAAMSTALAQSYGGNPGLDYGYYYGDSEQPYGFGPRARAHIVRVNAPGGAYIQCDGPNAPVRCTPDGW